MTENSPLPAGARERLAAARMPDRIDLLKRDKRGYPIPRFVDRRADKDGEPDFRVADGQHLARCIKQRLCWICGEPLGQYQCFAVGPMCAITRTVSEPPSHRECLRYSAQVCPFLAIPEMRRNERGLPEDFVPAPGVPLARNPGAIAFWTVRNYRRWTPSTGGILFDIGEPMAVEWWCRGRPATRDEVDASIASGLPILEAAARSDPEPGGMEALARSIEAAQPHLPPREGVQP